MKLNKIFAPIAAGTALLISGSALADYSTPSEIRGYNACLKQISKESDGLVTARQYLISRDGADANYYINATRWQDGKRDAVRFNCATTLGGKKVVSVLTEAGRFAQAPAQPAQLEVAGN